MRGTVVNRVNDEILNWQTKEKQLMNLFPEEIRLSKESLKNTASFYKSLLDKYRLTNDPDEKRSLLLLKIQVREIENKLYASVVSKLFRALNELLSPHAKQETQEVLAFNSETRLKNHLIRSGFGDIDADLSKHIQANKPDFSVPLSWTLNGDKKINFDLKFERDNTGQYNFVKYTASLQQDDDPKNYAKQTFDVTDRLTPTQAYNLLSGRAVEKEYISEGGEFHRVWKKLDFTDRDQAGNYKVTTIMHDKKFNVESEVNSLIDQGLILAPSAKTITDGIRNGNDQYVLFNNQGEEKVVYIKADAQNKLLRYSNEKHEPVTLLSLMGKETSQSMAQTIDNTQTVEHKQGIKM